MAVVGTISNRPAVALDRQQSDKSAIHPTSSAAQLNAFLSNVPRTNIFPPDFDDTLRSYADLFTVEMSTTPGCLPCADAWAKLIQFRAAYGWRVAPISQNDALLRSGRIGLPWVGHPMLWIRPRSDPERIIPVAIGTDHDANLRRNIYLGAKMLTGVRPAIGTRAMARFTGIVAPHAGKHPIIQKGKN